MSPIASKSKIDGGRDVWTCVGLAIPRWRCCFSRQPDVPAGCPEVAADSSRVYLAYAFLKKPHKAASRGRWVYRSFVTSPISGARPRPATRATLNRAMALMLAMVFAYESIFDKQHLDRGARKASAFTFHNGHVIVFVPSVFATLTMRVSCSGGGRPIAERRRGQRSGLGLSLTNGMGSRTASGTDRSHRRRCGAHERDFAGSGISALRTR